MDWTIWRESPFIRLLVPFTVGIILAHYFSYNSILLPLFAGVTLVASSLKVNYKFRWLRGIALLVTLISIGYYLTHFRTPQYPFTSFKSSIFTGVITKVPTGNRYLHIPVSIRFHGDQHILKPTNFKCMVTIKNDSCRTFKYGDLIAFKGKIKPIPPPKNPGTFNYKAYLSRQGINTQSFVKERNLKVLKNHQGSSLFANAYKWQEKLKLRLQNIIDTEKNCQTIAALLLGRKQELQKDIKEAYSKAGAIHVLAVSGLHVGLILTGLLWITGIIVKVSPRSNLIRVLTVLLGIWVYALITGCSPSVLRSSTMFSFLIVGKHLLRQTNTLNSLAASAFVLLFFSPSLIFDAGFQLSYTAVLGILIIYPTLYSRVVVLNPIADKIWQLIAISVAAQIATFPISLYYFHQFPIFFWASSLIAIPLVAIILPLSCIALIGNSIPLIGPILSYLLNTLLSVLNYSIEWVGNLPNSTISGLWPNQAQVLLLYLIVIVICFWFKTKSKLFFRAAIVSILLSSLLQLFYKHSMSHDKQIIAYHHSKELILDFKDGSEAYTSSLGPVQHLATSRSFLSIKTLKPLNLRANGLNVIHWNQKRIGILDEALNSDFQNNLDVLVLRKGATLTKRQLQSGRFETLVFAPDCSFSQKKEIEKMQKKLGKTLYDIKNVGALRIPIY